MSEASRPFNCCQINNSAEQYAVFNEKSNVKQFATWRMISKTSKQLSVHAVML